MEKKNGLLTAALLATVLFMGGCSSEDSEMGTPAQPGSPILFSVADVQSQTRTVYKDRLQINWVMDDQVGICSTSDNVFPSVEGKSKTAEYKVTTLNADGHPHHAGIAPSVEGTYLKWGDNLNSPAVFYGAYPAERIVAYPKENSTVFSMQYYTNQECKVYSVKNGVYLTQPDMKNAYMVAKNELTPIGDHVLLAFDPIMTTPDITITAGSYEVGTGIIQPITVTGVSVIMPKKLSSSTLNYQITGVTNGSITDPRGELLNYTDGRESIFTQIDNNGKKCIDLYEGESINLTAFLPPIPQLKGAKIRVHTLGSTDFVKTVTDELKAQSRITIKLPDITPETTKPNNWISKLEGSTLLKEMSIPAYVCQENTDNELQKIDDLFRKGVRAFDAERFTSTSGLIPKKKTIATGFINKINDLFVEEKNQGEFVIVWVENDGSLIIPDNWSTFHDKIADARNKIIILEKHDKGLLLGDNSFSDAGKNNTLFLYSTLDNATDFKVNNTNWTAQLISNKNLNKDVYSTIVNSKLQTGCTGIVTIPNAGITFDDTYGDLLLQAIIDCNFKFKH